MTFSIPEVDQLGWGEPLQNHLAQLNDPETGGLIHVLNVAERDSKFWPNGAIDKDEYANKTVYVIGTGTFHVWTISTDPGNTRYWKELQKTVGADGWLAGSGTVQGYGYELRGTGTSFNSLNKHDQIKIDNGIYTIQEVVSSTVLKLTSTAAFEYIQGGGGYWQPYPNINLVSISGNTVTWDAPVSSFGGKIGDVFLPYNSNVISNIREGIITAISGNSATVEWITNSWAGGITPHWSLYRAILPGKSYSFQTVSQVYNNGENDTTIFYPSGFLRNNGAIQSVVIAGPNQGSNVLIDPKGFISLNNNINGVTRGYLLIGANGSGARGAPALPGVAEIMAHGEKGQQIRLSTILGHIDFLTAAEQTTTPDVRITTGSNESLRRMGIGTLTPSEKLHVVGNILATGTITPGSDRRWKKDIIKIDSALEKISLLEGVTYNWKDEEQETRGKERQIGLIAQDVEKTFPEAVKKDNEGYMSVNYDGLVGALVEGIKELKLTIDLLTERITILESK